MLICSAVLSALPERRSLLMLGTGLGAIALISADMALAFSRISGNLWQSSL